MYFVNLPIKCHYIFDMEVLYKGFAGRKRSMSARKQSHVQVAIKFRDEVIRIIICTVLSVQKQGQVELQQNIKTLVNFNEFNTYEN